MKIYAHCFESAGLGKAPYKYDGMTENVFDNKDGTTKAGGCCDYCFAGIRYEYWLKSADGKRFKVGCDCVAKVGDTGLLKIIQHSPEFVAHKLATENKRALAVDAELNALISANSETFRSHRHPLNFNNLQTNEPLSYMDYVEWMMRNCGRSGKAKLLRTIKKHLEPK